MSKLHRRLERLTVLALLGTAGLSIYYWDEVERAHRGTRNVLGTVETHVPTADLFLWTTAAIILYAFFRMWGAVGPHVFTLSPDAAARWRTGLLWTRAAVTLCFLTLTLFTIFGRPLQSH